METAVIYADVMTGWTGVMRLHSNSCFLPPSFDRFGNYNLRCLLNSGGEVKVATDLLLSGKQTRRGTNIILNLREDFLVGIFWCMGF